MLGPVELQAEYVANVFRSVRAEMNKIVVGHGEIIDHILISFFCGGHVLLEGVPGLGKTLMVRTLANILAMKFARIQFTPDLMPADIIGTTIVVQSPTGEKAFRFQKGPVFSNVILADEINRATAKTQSALLEAMAEATVSIAGKSHPLPQPFFVLGTMNPLEMEGTYALPEAQLDRFFFKVLVPFPDKDDLNKIIDRNVTNQKFDVESKVSPELVNRIKALIRDVPIASPVKDYVSKLVLATQPSSRYATKITKKYIAFGASPRGLLTLVHAAKCRALTEGRLNVSPEDVKAVAIPALRHRIILNFEAEAEGITSDFVVTKLLELGESF